MVLFKVIHDWNTRKNEKIPAHVQSSFLKRLSDLLREGYTFYEAVSMLIPFHVKNSDFVMNKITEVHKNGQSVTEVFKLLGFPNRLLLPINLATTHGRLQETLEMLSVQAAIFERAQKRMNSLLMYPVFLFIVIFVLFTIFKIYFMPNMESLMGSRDQSNSDGSIVWSNLLLSLPNYLLISMLVLALIIVVSRYYLMKKSVQIRLSIYEKIPVINSWNRLTLTRTFSREIGGLLESGMSLQQAFDAIIIQKEHKVLQFIATQMREKIVHGESFSKSVMLLDHFTEDFHHFVIHGENSGFLGRELTLYSEFLTERIEVKLTKVLNVIQPTLFLVIAVFIVGAYLAILLPIYDMINIV